MKKKILPQSIATMNKEELKTISGGTQLSRFKPGILLIGMPVPYFRKNMNIIQEICFYR